MYLIISTDKMGNYKSFNNINTTSDSIQELHNSSNKLQLKIKRNSVQHLLIDIETKVNNSSSPLTHISF